jgi:hypothetical protein
MIAPILLKAHFQLETIRTRALIQTHPNAHYVTADKKIFLKRKDGKHYLVLDELDERIKLSNMISYDA